jgi:hypothetical protein
MATYFKVRPYNFSFIIYLIYLYLYHIKTSVILRFHSTILIFYTFSILNYNSFDFLSNLVGLSYSIFFVKNRKLKTILKVYYMLNNIGVKINNNYENF